MADDDENIKERVDSAQDSIETKKAKARARFFGMADRLEAHMEENPPARDELREKLNRIRQYVRQTEET